MFTETSAHQFAKTIEARGYQTWNNVYEPIYVFQDWMGLTGEDSVWVVCVRGDAYWYGPLSTECLDEFYPWAGEQ